MIGDLPPLPPKAAWDLRIPRRAIRAAVSTQTLRRLHQRRRGWDAALFFGSWVAFAGLWCLLAILPLGMLWIACGLLQGLVVINHIYAVRHDLFFHRQILGPRASYALAVMCSLPLLSTYTRFLGHEDHHVYVGWDLFEERLTHLDRRWKRWLCLTPVGLALLLSDRLRPRDAPQPNAEWKPPLWFLRQLEREQRVHLLFRCLVVTGVLLWPAVFLKGFLLPVLLFSPIILSIRIAFQHSEADPGNPFHLGVYYRPSRLTRFMFLNTLGDGHIVHHLFPHIPTYHVGEAAKLFHPMIAPHVPERGFFAVVWRYLIKAETYRTRWEDQPATTVDPGVPYAEVARPRHRADDP